MTQGMAEQRGLLRSRRSRNNARAASRHSARSPTQIARSSRLGRRPRSGQTGKASARLFQSPAEGERNKSASEG